MAVLAAENVSYTYQSKYQKVQALKNVSCTLSLLHISEPTRH